MTRASRTLEPSWRAPVLPDSLAAPHERAPVPADRSRWRSPVFSASLALACDPTPAATPCADVISPAPLAGPPTLTAPCSGPVADPGHLLITTTDFSTGAVSLLDLRTATVTPDLALGSTDAVPFYADGRAFVLHRFMIDALDVLAPDTLALLGQVGLAAADVPSTNPHALALADDLAYVTLFATPQLQVLDLADPAAPHLAATIDLCPLADADGNPEASLIIRCGDALFVSVQRLDRDHGFALTGEHDHLAAIDRTTGRIHDLDPAAPGVQPLPLLGPWAKQWRLDPGDPDGHTLLVLSSGLERIDLATGSVTWAVHPDRLVPLGITDYRQPQAFDSTAEHLYLAAYTADFDAVLLARVALTADTPPELLADDLQSVEQTLEVTGDTLWFGDRSHGRAGLRAWDLSVTPPKPRFSGPLSTGLAPYSLIAIP